MLSQTPNFSPIGYLNPNLPIEITDNHKPGDIWAIALSADGQYLASSSINGRVNVWSLSKNDGLPKIREYETKGSFGLCVDLVCSILPVTFRLL